MNNIADILRTGFNDYLKQYGKQPKEYYKVVNAITACKTAQLGGHILKCDDCGHEHISYNSCRNRHCPTCQGRNRAEWVEKRIEELLPVQYFHVVFTIPQELNPFAIRNKKVVYNILFKAASETISELAKDKKWINADIGFTTVLHTWGQQLMEHPHLHCIVPGGGLVKGKKKWKHCRDKFLFPIDVMKKLFRGKFMSFFKEALKKEDITLCGFLEKYKNKAKLKELIDTMYSKTWCIYAKAPFAGPEAVIKYLGNYTHRIAISNRRIVKIENGKVTFTYKDRSDNNKQKFLTLVITEFIRRFLMHILPHRFTRIRYYGIFCCRTKNEKLKICRDLLIGKTEENIDKGIKQIVSIDFTRCPICKKGHLIIHKDIEKLIWVSSIPNAA